MLNPFGVIGLVLKVLCEVALSCSSEEASLGNRSRWVRDHRERSFTSWLRQAVTPRHLGYPSQVKGTPSLDLRGSQGRSSRMHHQPLTRIAGEFITVKGQKITGRRFVENFPVSF